MNIPDPLRRPAARIHPVTKRQAPPEVRALLDEIQDALGIPWAPASWRAYALYPEAMVLLWKRLEPATRDPRFLSESLDITRAAYSDAQVWFREAQRLELSAADQRAIRWEIDAFEFGNPQVMLQQHLLVEALTSTTAAQGADAFGESELRLQSPYRYPEVQLVEEPGAPENVRRVYADIQRTLGTALVNTDYQALAKWPECFEAAWRQVKPWLRSPEYVTLCQRIRWMGQAALERLPALEPIPAEALERAVGSADDREHLLGMVAEFTELTPELIAVDALFRVQVARAAVSDETGGAVGLATLERPRVDSTS